MRSIASTVCSISDAVVSLPNEKRMAEAARLRRPAHRKQDMGGDHGADHASRAARGADPLEIERHEKRFRGKAGETDIECVGKARRPPGVQLRCGENVFDAPPQLIAQTGLAFLFVRQTLAAFPRPPPPSRRSPEHSRSPAGVRLRVIRRIGCDRSVNRSGDKESRRLLVRRICARRNWRHRPTPAVIPSERSGVEGSRGEIEAFLQRNLLVRPRDSSVRSG